MFLLAGFSSEAQVACSYTFSYRTDLPFEPLTNSVETIILASGAANPGNPSAISPTDEDIFPGQPIGFSFQFNGQAYSHCGVATNGWIWFGEQNPIVAAGVVIPFTNVLQSETNIEGIISALNGDLEGRWTAGEASVRTRRSGAAPNRTFIIEWNNFKSMDDAEGTGYCGENRNRFDFQIILSENEQSVSFAYRASEYCWQGYEQFFQIGLRGSHRSDVHARSVVPGSNPWNNSLQGLNNSTVAIKSSSPTVLPAQNARFVFSPGLPQTAIWLGLNNNWHDAANWNPAIVPTRCTNVTIGSGASHFPQLSGNVPAHCANLIIHEGASLTLAENFNSFLSVSGNLVNNGVLINNTNTYISLSGSENQQLGGTGHFLDADLFITGASEYTLQNDLVIRNLHINHGASLKLSEFVLDVFSIIQEGVINQGSGVLVIEGDASVVQLNDSTFEEASGTTFFGNGEVWSNPLNQLVPSLTYNNLWIRTHKDQQVQIGTDEDFLCRNLMFYNPGEAGGLAVTHRSMQVSGDFKMGVDSLPGTRLQLNHPISRINGSGNFSMGNQDALHIKASPASQQQALTGFNHPYFAGSVHYDSNQNQTLVAGTYNNLRISGSGARTIQQKVNLKGVLKLDEGTLLTNDSLTLKSDSASTGLISGTGQGTIEGTVESERYIHGSGQQQVFISNPFEGLQLIDYAHAIPVPGPDGVAWEENSNSSVWEYDPLSSGDQFTQAYYSLGASRELIRGKGYSVKLEGGSVLSSRGASAGGEINIPLLLSGNNSTFDGFNLIGNPYLSPIDWNKVASDQSPMISKTIYRMGTGNRYNGSLSAWLAISENEGLGINGAGPNIGIQEGFFVKAFSADTLRLKNSHRSDITRVDAVQVSTLRSFLKLSLVNGEKRDETLIWYDADNNSDEALEGQDAIKLNLPNATMLFSQKANLNLAIQGRQTVTDSDSIPLGVQIANSGYYTFRLSEVVHFSATAMIYLEDRISGTFQNLRTEPDYSVFLNEGTIQNRFFIHYRAGIEANAIQEGCSGGDGQISFNNSSATLWDVRIVNSNDSIVAERSQVSGSWLVQALRADEYHVTYLLSGQSLQVDEWITINAGNAIEASMMASLTEVKQEEEEVVFTNTSSGSESVFWDLGDGMMLSGEDEVSHYYSDPGTYNVIMRVTRAECSDTAMVQVRVITITGIENAATQEPFSLFPNPASTLAYIKPDITETLSNLSYVVVDASGRIAYQRELQSLSPGELLELPVSDLPPGTYQVVINAGKFRGVSRLMVSR